MTSLTFIWEIQHVIPAQQQRLQEWEADGINPGFLGLCALGLGAPAWALITAFPLGHAQGCTGSRHTKGLLQGFSAVWDVMSSCWPPSPLTNGGIKWIILLFSVVFFQETNRKAILLCYHIGHNSILQLWFKSPLQYRIKLGVCMSFPSISRQSQRRQDMLGLQQKDTQELNIYI